MQDYFLKGLLGRASQRGLFSNSFINIRDFSNSKHRKVDDFPYSDHQGMILKVDVLARAISSIDQYAEYRLLYMCPKGPVLSQESINRYSQESKGLIIIPGYYEGIDERLFDLFTIERVSLGNFILSSGELPALVIAEAVLRQIPDVVGNPESVGEDSLLSGLLEYPQYSNPRNYQGLEVPEVLVNGNHKLIETWRRKASIKHTLFQKPSLLAQLDITDSDKKIIVHALEGDPL